MRKKSINNLILVTVGLLLFISSININVFNHLNAPDKNNQDLRENLELSEYSTSIEGSGEDINITLHQSLVNTTTIQFSNIDTANTFSQPCPADSNFNSSLVNITIENLNAPDKRLEFETSPMLTERLSDYDYAIGFQVRGNCTLDNVSIMLSETYAAGSDDSDCVLRIYSAQWSGSQVEPSTNALTSNQFFTVYDAEFQVYHNFTGLNAFLDVTDTYDNYFFVVLTEPLQVNAYVDIEVNADTSRECLLYRDVGIWEYRNNLEPVMYVDLIPPTVTPTNLNITINDVAAEDSTGKDGFWNPSFELGSDSGKLNFTINANWWDVSCDITKVQINYTKTDLKATSMFNVLGGGQDVQWDVSRTDGLNLFDPRLSNYRINFTIPSSWNNIQVFNGSIDKTNDVLINPEKKGYKTVHVVNAGNGTYWHLTATSENLLTSIDTYVNSNPTNIVSYSDIVDFNTTFKELIGQNDGVINLSVYNPSTIDGKLIFSSFNSTFNSGTEFYLGSWDISDNVTQYGEFRVQVSWSNNTAAGFNEKILTIIGETDLALITPSQDATFYTDQSFDIIVYFKDFNLLTPIEGTTIEYNIDGKGFQSTTENNGTIGYYVIPVDCSVFTSDGLKSVDISVNKQYYDSQLLTYSFNVIVVEEPAKTSRPAIPGYNIIALIGLCFGITIALTKNKYKK